MGGPQTDPCLPTKPPLFCMSRNHLVYDHVCDPVNEDTTQASNFSNFPKTWTLQTAYTGHVE